MRTIGRYGSEVYPERQAAAPPTPPEVFEFDQNTTSYSQITGNPTVQIATATINLQAGSRVLVQGLASVLGSVAAGRAILQAADATNVPLPGSVVGSQSFGTTAGLNFRTMNLLYITDAQPAGPFTVHLIIDVNGAGGARVDSAGATVLTLTEIPAP